MTIRCRTLLLDKPCPAMQALALLAPEDATAIAEGRVFVDRRRIRDACELLAAGQTVLWNAPRASASKSVARANLVIGRRHGLIAAAKPAAWSSEPDRTGTATSLRDQLARTLRCNELHVLTRLDVGVSGLVIAAMNASGRRHWTKVMATGGHRRYLAILAGRVPESGTWNSTVEETAGARPAITHFERIAQSCLGPGVSLGSCGSGSTVSLVSFRPETGRRHQLRLHSSRALAPIVGDRRYAGPSQFVDSDGRVTQLERIFLHAITTTIRLPDDTLWQPACPLDEDFRELWFRLGGTARDFPKEAV